MTTPVQNDEIVTIRIGSRGSPLAVQQAEDFAARFVEACNIPVQTEIVTFTTSGDQLLDKRLQDAGGKGLFTRELDVAQLDGEVDIAVHSLKDVPNDIEDGLEISCFLAREDARDALIGPFQSLLDLPLSAVLGTASLRRGAQALALRPDLEIVMFRGNVQTRLRKLDEGRADATLLATAGLNRLNMLDKAAAIVPVDHMLPAVGQGIVCATIRYDADDFIRTACKAIDTPASRLAATAERAFLKRLDGSCRTPIAAYFRETESGVLITGEVLKEDGSKRWRAEKFLDHTPNLEEAESLGLALANEVIALRGKDKE